MGKWGRRRNEGDDRIKLCVSQIRKEKEEILKPIDFFFFVLFPIIIVDGICEVSE